MKECESIIQAALRDGRTSLLIHEAEKICELHGISTPKSYVARNLEEALSRVDEVGFPVALKRVSPQISHKSDVGGVLLNIKNQEELESAYPKLIDDVMGKAPSATILGVFVEKMMPASTEVIIGCIRDKQFGPSIMLGMGGIYAEVYGDAAFRVAPIDRIDAFNLIHELKGSKILEGARGREPADLDALADLLIRTSEMVIEHEEVNQLDLNPVIVYPKSVCAVDFRIIVEQTVRGI